MAVAVLCVLFAGMEAKSIMHVYDLKPASASLISPELSRSTQTSAEELTGLRQVSVRLEGGPAPSPQVRRGNCGAHHAGSSAGEYRIL